MRTMIDSVEEFAGLGKFFDAPLRTYSAGMIVRLSFAAITSVEAEILLIDEALAVGDAEFQLKCAQRIEDLRARGAHVRGRVSRPGPADGDEPSNALAGCRQGPGLGDPAEHRAQYTPPHARAGRGH